MQTVPTYREQVSIATTTGAFTLPEDNLLFLLPTAVVVNRVAL